MTRAEAFGVVILGSGQGGKQLAWHLARVGKKVATVERRWGRRRKRVPLQPSGIRVKRSAASIGRAMLTNRSRLARRAEGQSESVR